MFRDLRYALRALASSPGFVVVSVPTLALGLCLASTTFSILDTLRHPYMPVEDPARLFTIRVNGDARSPQNPWEAARAVAARFATDIGYYGFQSAVIAGGDNVIDGLIHPVTRNLFTLLGVQPLRGRLFQNDPGADHSAVIVSYQFWATSLGGRPIEDATVLINDRVYTVIGVMPPQFTFPGGPLWVPMPDPAHTGEPVFPVVRLRRGVSWEDATHDLQLSASRLNAHLGADRYPFKFRLEPVAGDPLDLTSIHFAMAGAAAIVLLIACANLANLMLARWEAKRRDTALRLAMGAKRSALIVQRFVEGLLLAAAGGVIGLLLTAWMVDFLAHNIPRYGALVTVPPHISWRVIAFGFLAAALTSVLFGLGPAFRMTEVTLNEPLKDGVGTTTARARRYSAIVVAEVALSLALLLGATLLTRAVIRAARYDFGYETRNLFSMSLGVNARQVGIDSASAGRIINSVANRVRLIPGVRRAGTVHWSWPVGYMIMSDAYNGAGGYLASNAAAIVSPDFLGTLGIRVVQGRDFLPGDQARGAAILDEDAARELFGARVEAVGRSIKLGAYRSSAPWLPVVGVVERANITGYRPGYDRPTVYVASDQYPARRARLVMRVEERNAQASLALRSAIRGTLPPGADAGRVTPYAEYFERDLRSRRFIVRVFLLFSAFALGLAGVGVYGVVAYGVNARLREFAVRVALGAESLRVFKLVLHDGAVMLLAGTGLGAFAAMWCAQILDAWLYDVYFVDATSLIVAEAVLLAAGFAACIQPALRATQADPVEMLRAT